MVGEYRSDDRLGVGYCPRCYREISLTLDLFGVCSEHGRVPADFFRPRGWVDPDQWPEAYGYRESGGRIVPCSR